MNITLSVDEKLVKEVRKIAIERDTTLSALIRDYMERLAAENAAGGRKRRDARPWKGASRSCRSRLGNQPGGAKTCMRGLEFLDTNVLVYSYDISDRRKQEVARGLVRRALAGGLVTSTQVLGEFAAALLHKVSPRVDAPTLHPSTGCARSYYRYFHGYRHGSPRRRGS